jgi:hypothetical protein
MVDAIKGGKPGDGAKLLSPAADALVACSARLEPMPA